MEGYWWGGGEQIMGEKVQGIRSINGRYKIDKGRLRIVWEMEKSKNLYVRPWTGTKGWVDAGGRGRQRGKVQRISSINGR